MVDANKWPITVEEAVGQLVSTMPEEDIETLRNRPEKDLFLYHFGLGMYIRNQFGLWSGNEALLKSCGSHKYPESAFNEYMGMITEPDDASGEIIRAL